MRRLPNNQMEFNIGLGVKAHSLDVVADIIGTMRMQKIIEITENVQPNEKERIEQLDKELHILTIEEKIVLGLNPYNLNEEDANTIRQSVIDKVIRLYAPILKKFNSTTIRDSVLTNSERELYLCRQKESWVITSLCPMSIQRHGRVTRINARQTAISH